jgi:hypothetical protein
MAHTSATSLAEPATTVASDLETPLTPCPVAHMDSADSQQPASHRVFEAEELLENILSFLPVSKVFGVQRVSKSWKAAIAFSPSIQRKLFLSLTKQEPETWLWVKARDPMAKLRRITASLLSFLGDRHRYVLFPVALNPMAEKWGRSARLRLNAHTAAAALNNRHVSLWDTLVCDPPCHRVRFRAQIWFEREKNRSVRRSHEDLKFPWEAVLNVESDTGPKIGDLVEAVLKTCGDVWSKHRPDDIGRYHHYEPERTTLQNVISEFNKFLHMPSDGTNPCMDLDFTPDGTCDYRMFPRSMLYIASDKTEADVDAIYAAEGEPAGYLRHDQEDVWKPLVVCLNRQRHG